MSTKIEIIEAPSPNVYFTCQYREIESLCKTLERISDAWCRDIAINTQYEKALSELEAETFRALTAVVRTYIHGDYITSGLMAANRPKP